jgi:hypothetical protein
MNPYLSKLRVLIREKPLPEAASKPPNLVLKVLKVITIPVLLEKTALRDAADTPFPQQARRPAAVSLTSMQRPTRP